MNIKKNEHENNKKNDEYRQMINIGRMTTKILSLTVLAVFILSLLPGALAGEAGQMPPNQTAKRSFEQMEKAGKRIQAEAKERFEPVQEKFAEAKEKYLENKKEFRERRDRLRELNEQAKCREETADCQERKDKLRKGIGQHLVGTIELIERSLEKLASRIEASGALSEEQKAEALAGIDQLEARLAEKKAELETSGEELTASQLKEEIKKLKALWQETRREQREIITDLIRHRQESIVEVYTQFGERIEARADSLAAQGADVSRLQEKLAEYQEKVDELKKVGAGERQEFRTVSREAKSLLRQLLSELKAVKSGVEAVEEQKFN